MSQSDYFEQLRLDFETFYYQKLWLKLTQMEEQRLKYLHRFLILLFLAVVVLPCFIIWMWGEWIYLIFTQGTPKEIESLIKLGLLIFSVVFAVVGSPIVSYKRAIKDSIIEDFISFFGQFKHSSSRRISDQLIEQSLLFNRYNRHRGDDYFYGTYKNVEMVISEEDLRYKGGKSESSVFNGIIVLLDFPKSFKGQTVIFKDWNILNFAHKPAKEFQRVALEDVVFEKAFEVYATDQIEARFLLSTAFMERILSVQKAFEGRKIQFSFFENKLLLAINTSIDMFEPASLFKSSTDRRPINAVLEQFISVFAVAELLKLIQQ